jgi:ABC-type Mn2+/Zn2+ transport system ATPase subunit
VTDTLISLEHVTAGYQRGHDVLSEVTVEIGRGTFAGIVGPSGAGKTSLLRLLLGTLTPTSGHIVRPASVRIGFVPQVETIDWNFPVTVGECVAMAIPQRRWRPWRSPAEHRLVADALERLGLADLGDRHIRRLSGGQQQRVFLARALLAAPDLLLLDEPTSGVDVRTRHEIVHLLGELHEQGTTIVLTTHDLNGMAAHLPRLVCVNRTVVGDGAPLEVLTPAVLERTFGAPLEVLIHGGLPVVVDRRRILAPVSNRLIPVDTLARPMRSVS